METQSMEEKTVVPEFLFDYTQRKIYKRQRFLGKGGFAACYEVIDEETQTVYAAKVASKARSTTEAERALISQEIDVHRELEHPHIVKFVSTFEDSRNIYIILELCKNGSMLQLYDNRGAITEYECRYYMFQIVQGLRYLHEKRIIHRDLSLANLLLDDSLHVKICDFGLSACMREGQLEDAFCGTPNYMAPEIVNGLPYSCEVDLWSLGCIMYRLLMGRKPFRNTLTFCLPRNLPVPISLSATRMIRALLQRSPKNRPTISQLANFSFLKETQIPLFLPCACLIEKPHPDLEVAHIPKYGSELFDVSASVLPDTSIEQTIVTTYSISDQADVKELLTQLRKLFRRKPRIFSHDPGDALTDAAAQPKFWITNWMNYSVKYGFGYQNCDGGFGALFNDQTQMLLSPNGINIKFIDNAGCKSYMSTTNFDEHLEKKMKILVYFKSYIIENLKGITKAAAGINVSKNDENSTMTVLLSYIETTCGLLMHLSNSTVQFNFLDHVKIILNPQLSAVTVIDRKNKFRTYRFGTLATHGMSKQLYRRLTYTMNKLTQCSFPY